LRSGTLWSVGINATEGSILNAYTTMISEAEHYVYIENQFFISQLGGSDVRNPIGKTIFDRIVRAHQNRETFRVYVVMPLLPAFEKQSGSLQVVLHWTYVSISKGPYSLLRKLREEIGDPSPYITFCSLRKHSKLLDKLVTELIYIHSKLIIVDDRLCLIGSANINDRSQLGERDSELAVYFEDTKFTDSKMNGKEYKSGLFAGSIRRYLFSEHLGLLPCERGVDEENKAKYDIEIDDPVCPDFFKQWNGIAKKNTKIYERVFECAPSDNIRTLEDFARNEMKKPLAEKDVATATKLLTGVHGYLVQFPTLFLIDSELAPSILTPEGMMPTYVFV